MTCDDARERLTAHLLGQDDAPRDHIASCDGCARETAALRATLDLLDRYSRATARTRRFTLLWPAAAAIVVIGIAMYLLAPRAALTSAGPYLVADADGWRFARGTTTLTRELRVVTLPGVPVDAGALGRIEGDARARVSPAGLSMEPRPEEEMPILLAVSLSVEAGVAAGPHLEGLIATGDEPSKLLALRLAVLAELRELAPAIRRAAAGDASAEVRRAALHAVWRLEPDRAFFRERAARDPAALRYLGSCAADEDLPALAAAIPDADVILGLAHATRRGLRPPPEVDARVRAIFGAGKERGRVRYACVRYLQERELLAPDAARTLLFDGAEESAVRRMAAATLLSDETAAVEDFRRLFDTPGRVIAIDLLCHYGTMDDARRVGALLDSGTSEERARAFYALGLRANAELRPPVPLRPDADEADAVRKRLLEWVNR